jgi:multidrug efflux pump subunit AcrB
MISSVFIDRPRLAVVIAVLITLAGLLALLRIPVAQFPDIVPPQVSVTTSYPGASAAVVEATVAQPLEAQIVGADKMLYMRSYSGNDGSYSLTVSFALGTDPNIDVVNVENRVRSLPPFCNSSSSRARRRRSSRSSSATTSRSTCWTCCRARRAWARPSSSARRITRCASG